MRSTVNLSGMPPVIVCCDRRIVAFLVAGAFAMGLVALCAEESATTFGYTAFSVMGGKGNSQIATAMGTAVVCIKPGTIAADAKPLPYRIRRPGIAQFEKRYLHRPLRIASALIDTSIIGRYYLESYLDPETLTPIRAVRWKKDCADIVLDFTAPGEVTVTKAEKTVPGWLARLAQSTTPVAYDVEPESTGDAVGTEVTDLLGAFLRVRERLKNAESISRPVYLFGMKKARTSVYCARLDAGETTDIELTVDKVTLQRRCRAFTITLSYTACFEVTQGLTPEAVWKKYFPERSREEAQELLGDLAGAPLADCVGQLVAVPVSMPTYNRVFTRDKGFKGPFGLSEAGKLWADAVTGVPVVLEGKAYGIGIRLVLSSAPGLFPDAKRKAPNADSPK